MTSNDAKMQKLYTCFNKKMSEFLVDLVNAFPQDNDFKTFKNSFNLVKIASEDKPFHMFHFYVSPYKDKILSKDESFFIQKDYNSSSESVTQELIQKLKTYWDTMNDGDKDTVWNYLGLLLKLTSAAN